MTRLWKPGKGLARGRVIRSSSTEIKRSLQHSRPLCVEAHHDAPG